MSTEYYDLGPYTRPVRTASPEAQRWFDRGLIWTYGFNQDEAVRCFERAIELDPECAMAHWGLAYAHGPYVNKDWRFYSDEEFERLLPIMHDSARRAVALSESGDRVEHALATALTMRYPSPVAAELDQMWHWHDAFADAMRDVYRTHPDDPEVAAVFVEAMMMRTPWLLWDLATGDVAPGASTAEMVEVLERAGAFATDRTEPAHPGVQHMAIHTLEMSMTPERALPAADALRGIVPDAGHLQHMPSHIDVLCGHYADAIAANERAVAADLVYLDQVGPFGQYTADICHDNHLLMYAGMLAARWEPGIRAADLITELVSPEVLDASTPAFAITLEAYASMRMHVFVRFGKWAEILAEPNPSDPERYPVTTAMHHYASAIAAASLGEHDRADVSAARFRAQVLSIPEDRHLFNNTSRTVLSVAEAMMAGELAYHRGLHAEGFDHLREAVRRNDALFYTEPWAWMHPPRHALGALLLEQGHVEEAEQVYREDLGLASGVPRANVHPDNVWALHGLVECLTRRSASWELAEWQPKLDAAAAEADSPVTSSCACRLGG